MKTTVISTEVLTREGRGVRSPVDLLWRVFTALPDLRQRSSKANSQGPLVPADHQLMPDEQDPDTPTASDVKE